MDDPILEANRAAHKYVSECSLCNFRLTKLEQKGTEADVLRKREEYRNRLDSLYQEALRAARAADTVQTKVDRDQFYRQVMGNL